MTPQPSIWRRFGAPLLILLAFVVATVALRGAYLEQWAPLNPDEAELMAQARAALVSPVPFTTWTTTTTGPFWVLFLALLGFLGLPLTVVFAHLLSALLAGLIGFLSWLLLCRALGPWMGTGLAIAAWAPLALVYPLGGPADFGALSTELLPSVLILGAALIPVRLLDEKPWLFLVSGLLCGLAVGAKYQALPVAGALLVVHLIVLAPSLGRLVRSVLLFAAGAVFPFALVGLSMVLSPAFSWILVEQNLNFLAAYAGNLDLPTRVSRSLFLIGSQPYALISLVVLFVLSWYSTPRVIVSRAILAASGVIAVLAGGMGFPHYLILAITGVVLAAALPISSSPVVAERRQRVFIAAFVAAMLAFVAMSGIGRVNFAGPRSVAASLSADSVQRTAELSAACPPGSQVLVWGWAPELYVNYSWANAIPIMNVLQLTSAESNRESGETLVLDAISDPATDCVVDAVGQPFFGFDAEYSLLRHYPNTVSALEDTYLVVPNLVNCDDCTVFVRR